MARLPRILGIIALGFVVACGSEESQPSGPNGNGSGGTSAAGGRGGSAGNSGASGASGTSGSDGSGGTTGGSGGSTGGATGTGGSNGGTDGSSGTNGASGAAGSGATGGTGGTAATAGTGGTAGAAGTAGTNGASGTGGVATPYPAGPYGKMVGNTIENYQFNGYVNDAGTALSNTLPQRDYSLDDVRKSGARYALIHLSAFYCAGCRSAADDLGNLSAPVQAAGGRVIEVLFRGNSLGAEPGPVLSAWVTTYDLKVTTVVPKAGNTLVTSDAMRENAYIVDLTTMKIVWTAFGSYGATTNSSAKQGLVKMQELLAAP